MQRSVLERARSLYDREFLRFDAAFTALVVALMALVLHWTGADVLDLPTRTSFYSTIASILGGLVGFVITAFSIVMALMGDTRLEVLRKSAHFDTLVDVYLSGVKWMGSGAVFGLAALVLDRGSLPIPGAFQAALLLLGLSVARLWRAVTVLRGVVRVVGKPPPKVPEFD